MKLSTGLFICVSLLSSHLLADELNCQTCHGSHLQGNEITGAPALFMLSENYIRAQLNAFKQGYRAYSEHDQPGLDMLAVAKQLSSEQIESAITLVKNMSVTLPSEPTIKAPNAWQSCVACHGANGAGNDALAAPAIKGQTQWYVAKQLNDYQQGLRGINKDDLSGQLMRQISLSLSSDDVQLLSQFLNQSAKMETK
jgi:cytochrome c553